MTLTKFERTCIWVSYLTGIVMGAFIGQLL